MQSYIIAGLVAVLLVLGFLHYRATAELSVTKQTLAVALEVHEKNLATIKRQELSIANTDRIMAEWGKDRTTLNEVRNATRAGIKEAMQDETYKTWHFAPVPPDAWRMLDAPVYPSGVGSAGPTDGAAAGLSGDADTRKRD